MMVLRFPDFLKCCSGTVSLDNFSQFTFSDHDQSPTAFARYLRRVAKNRQARSYHDISDLIMLHAREQHFCGYFQKFILEYFDSDIIFSLKGAETLLNDADGSRRKFWTRRGRDTVVHNSEILLYRTRESIDRTTELFPDREFLFRNWSRTGILFEIGELKKRLHFAHVYPEQNSQDLYNLDRLRDNMNRAIGSATDREEYSVAAKIRNEMGALEDSTQEEISDLLEAYKTL